jgi:hypothetical protein
MLESLGSVLFVPGEADGTFTPAPAGSGTPVPAVGAVELRPLLAFGGLLGLGAGVTDGAGPSAKAAASHNTVRMAAAASNRLGRYMAFLLR